MRQDTLEIDVCTDQLPSKAAGCGSCDEKPETGNNLVVTEVDVSSAEKQEPSSEEESISAEVDKEEPVQATVDEDGHRNRPDVSHRRQSRKKGGQRRAEVRKAR